MKPRSKKPAVKAPTGKKPKKFSLRMMPRIKALLEIGATEADIARFLEVETEVLGYWMSENPTLQDAFDRRDEMRRWDEAKNLAMARSLAAQGATDLEIAQAFGVTPRTLSRWKLLYPDFGEALELGREKMVEMAEKSLFRRAIGYHYDIDKLIVVKGALIKVRSEEFVPPSDSALKLYLEANAPDRYVNRGKGDDPTDPVEEFRRAIEDRAKGFQPVERDNG